MLTRKQKELLLLVQKRIDLDGVPPSFDEMREHLGLHSKSGIHRLIVGLEERGFIRRLPHRARALEILRLPTNLEGKAKPDKKGRVAPRHEETNVSIPLYGRIAAGTPIEALRDPSAHIDIPMSLLQNGKGRAATEDHYALEVSGDSMIEAGILDGDKVIIRKADTADNGTIVVALVGEEATLKYLERRAGQIALVPANPRYPTQLFAPDRVQVQGQLVGLVRRY